MAAVDSAPKSNATLVAVEAVLSGSAVFFASAARAKEMTGLAGFSDFAAAGSGTDTAAAVCVSEGNDTEPKDGTAAAPNAGDLTATLGFSGVLKNVLVNGAGAGREEPVLAVPPKGANPPPSDGNDVAGSVGDFAATGAG